MMLFTVFDTAAGWVGILSSGTGLRRATLPQETKEAAYSLLGDLEDSVSAPRRFAGLVGRYRAYFSGREVDFPDKLDYDKATDFQRKVWQAACQIPYGQTRSYAWVAGKAGNPKAARAVGQALARNPLPVIVPCHRVLAGDGGLGGFSGGLGVKAFLLGLEAGKPEKKR